MDSVKLKKLNYDRLYTQGGLGKIQSFVVHGVSEIKKVKMIQLVDGFKTSNLI